jgi:hypothetical protein
VATTMLNRNCFDILDSLFSLFSVADNTSIQQRRCAELAPEALQENERSGCDPPTPNRGHLLQGC